MEPGLLDFHNPYGVVAASAAKTKKGGAREAERFRKRSQAALQESLKKLDQQLSPNGCGHKPVN